MAPIYVVKFVWSGLKGGTGLSQHAIDATDPSTIASAVSALRAFYSGVATKMPGSTSIKEDPQVDQFEHTTGDLIGSESITPGAPITGQLTTAYGAGVGAQVTWTCSQIQNGHRVQGRTFLVPLVVQAFDTDGSLTGDTVTAFQNAAANVTTYNTGAADGRIAIWGRPRPATAETPGRTATLGYISGYRVPDKPAWLRGRRE